MFWIIKKQNKTKQNKTKKTKKKKTKKQNKTRKTANFIGLPQE